MHILFIHDGVFPLLVHSFHTPCLCVYVRQYILFIMRMLLALSDKFVWYVCLNASIGKILVRHCYNILIQNIKHNR